MHSADRPTTQPKSKGRAVSSVPSNDPTEILQHVVRAAEGQYDAATWAWLCDGIGRWLNAIEPVSLEACLGLTSGRGGTTLRAERARHRRDHWLRIAWETVTDDEDASPWQRSKMLAEEMGRFESRGIWRRLQESPAPLEGLSELRTALFHVFSSGALVPRSAVHVHRVATSSESSNVVDESV